MLKKVYYQINYVLNDTEYEIKSDNINNIKNMYEELKNIENVTKIELFIVDEIKEKISIDEIQNN